MNSFFTHQPFYDFDRLYSNFQLIKSMRESRNYRASLNFTIVEEETRLLALKVFEGDLVSKKDYQALLKEKEDSERAKRELEARTRQLEMDLQRSEKNQESTLQEKRFLETVKIYFEGRPTALGETRDWILSTLGEEIERRADEKFKVGAAVACGAIDFIHKKITRRDNTPAGGEQS